MKMREIGRLIKDAGIKFWGDNGPRLSASIAFYTSLYLSPLLLTLVAIVGLVFGEQAARGEIVEQVRGLTGHEEAVAIEQLIVQSASFEHGIWSGLVVALTLIVGASGLFSTLQSALNTIWMVPGKRIQGGIVTVVRERLLDFLLVCGTALLLAVSLAFSTVVAEMDVHLSGWVPGFISAARLLNLVVSFGLAATLFAMVFKWLPETELAWSDVWLGAALTSGLIILGRFPIGFYLNRVAIGSAFGGAEAFALILIWVYYSAQILLFGAELTFVYATKYGHSVPKNENNRRQKESIGSTQITQT